MTFNDGGGLFDKYGMLQACINTLNTVEVRGYENMQKIINVASQIQAVKEGMKKEEEEAAKQTSENSEEKEEF